MGHLKIYTHKCWAIKKRSRVSRISTSPPLPINNERSLICRIEIYQQGSYRFWKVMEMEKKIPGPGKVLEIFFF